jgi:hypothetical protein
MPARRLHGAAALNDYLYLVGGMDVAGTTMLNSIYYLDPLSDPNPNNWSWTAATTVLPEGRAAFGGQVAVLNSSTSPPSTGIMVAGGRTDTDYAGSLTITVVAGQHS